MVILGDPEHTLLRFADRSFRWIDVKRFPWNGVGDDRSVLDTLAKSPRYRDTYLSPDSNRDDSVTIHGPYRVDRISADDFECLSDTAARGVVEEFRTLYQPAAPGLLEKIESLILPRLRDASCYRLRPVQDADHDLTFILEEFRELVTISRTRDEVALIVMAID